MIRALGLLLVIAALFFSPALRAQDDSEEPKGIESGGYNIQQAIEVGGRAAWVNGNQDTYNTFVHLGSGPRLFDYTLNMRSLDHQGFLFDNLNFSNFGYGGDPNDVSRLRINKNKWYDFNFLFRRDKNYWDYNLLANPLNPSISNPAIALTHSPHAKDLVRRMQDYNLTLLPESRVRFRLGYSRNVNEGPSFTTEQGTTIPLLLQNFRMTTNAYRAGVDFRILPKTRLSYDQYLEYDKQDTVTSLAALPYLIPGSVASPTPIPVDLGILWYSYPAGGSSNPLLAAGANPCASSPGPFPAATPGFANPNCKGFLSYTDVSRPRNFTPTERFSFQTTYFKNFQLSGSAGYSSSDNVVSGYNLNINEWTGGTANTGTRVATAAGPAEIKRVSVHSDLAGVYAVTNNFRIVDSFRYDNWRIPGIWDGLLTNLYAPKPIAQPAPAPALVGLQLPPVVFAPVVPTGPTFASICPGPTYSADTCPQHSGSSADVLSQLVSRFLGQNIRSNTFQLEADFTKRFSGRIGYLYESRRIADLDNIVNKTEIYFPGGGGNAGNFFLAARGDCSAPTNILNCTANADGSLTFTGQNLGDTERDITTITQHVALVGVVVRPMDTLRIHGDFEFGYSRGVNEGQLFSFTRVWPRQVQGYKIHATYTPRPWASIDGAVDISENRNNVTTVNDLEHSRTYSFVTVLSPNSKFTFDIGYNYSDIHAEVLICFRDAGFPNIPFTTATNPCPVFDPVEQPTVNLGATSTYTSGQHYFYGGVMWKPVKRVTLNVGYNGTFVGGNTLFLNPRQPAGPLAFNYQKPFAKIQVDLYKGLSYRTEWNYYGYNGKALDNPDPVYGLTIGSRDFNGSTATFALRYAF